MASSRPPTIVTQGSSGGWSGDVEGDARTPPTDTPSRPSVRTMSNSFGYSGSQTPKIPLRPLRASPHIEIDVAEPVDPEQVRSAQHRARFLTESQKILLQDPAKTRESYRELESNTTAAGWHDHTIDAVVRQLESDGDRGITSAEAAKRLARYGPNAIEGDKRAPVWVIFLMQFFNLIIGLLMAAALASIALQEYVEGLAIVAIVTLNAAIATLQENRAGNALEALAKMSSPQCLVIRDDRQQQISSEALVPGDIVILSTGDVVPADLRLLTSADLKVNEMILTGESEDVGKKFDFDFSQGTDKLTAPNMVFSSTAVAAGNATGIVVETGMGTRVGSIAALLREERHASGGHCLSRFFASYSTKMTPLQEALHRLGVFMGVAVLSVCAVVFVVGMVRGNHDPKNGDRPVWLSMVMVSVSLAVSAVPEGLPMVVTICLSTGTSAMVHKHVLVRKLAAVESLGGCSVICTDKTGTLTEGKMTAVKLWADSQEYAITSDGGGFSPRGDILLDGVKQTQDSNTLVHATLLAAVLCSNTTLQSEGDEWVPYGNASEAPLVVAAAKMGIWANDQLASVYPRVTQVPFNSSRKMMLTVSECTSSSVFSGVAVPTGTRYITSVKGAPNCLLPLCTHFCQRDGQVLPLSASHHAAIVDAVDELSAQALRVIALAIHPRTQLPVAFDLDDDADSKFATLTSDSLVFLGLVASMDPPRRGVKQAIHTARVASIRTVMITGDYLPTAVAIAKNIDLLGVGADVDAEAVDCSVLRPHGGGEYLTEHDLDAITSRTSVFARAQPQDKLEIVKSLQRQGLVAAMTGDGVNDAPALKEADIGVAMGLAGTEVAKGAADMVLTDDNFCSIVAAVEKGRAIYTNIQKFVCFLLSTNFGEISIIFIAIAVGLPNPLEPLQILVLNLFADGMAAVALSLEKGDPQAMKDRPRPKMQPIIHGRLWLLVAWNAFLIGLGALVVFVVGLYWNFKLVLLDDILAGAKTVADYKHVRCFRWQGVRQHWKLYANCAAEYRDGSPLFPFWQPGVDEFEDEYIYCRAGEYECLTEGVARAQTMAFIFITTMEMLRAYTARSFTHHVFVGLCSNKYMQAAAVGSVSLTLFVTFTPFVRDQLFGFAYIYWFQWLFAILTAVVCATLGELLKCFYRHHDRRTARWRSMSDGFSSVLLEIRHLRHHVENLEDKLQVPGHKKPARRLTLATTSTTPGQGETNGLLSRENSASVNAARLASL